MKTKLLKKFRKKLIILRLGDYFVAFPKDISRHKYCDSAWEILNNFCDDLGLGVHTYCSIRETHIANVKKRAALKEFRALTYEAADLTQEKS